MNTDPADAGSRPAATKLTVRLSPDLRRALRLRCATLDVSIMDFVTASLEMVLKAEIDPRTR